MGAIFLSASVPVEGRVGFDTADPYLIREAVSALVEVVIGRKLLVWGGHPAITPMVWAAAESLNLDYAACVRLFQSAYFEDRYPGDNDRFKNVTFVRAAKSREASLADMRKAMLKSCEFDAAVFIGGMEGIFDEYQLFREEHPSTKVLALDTPGGAARELAEQNTFPGHLLDDPARIRNSLSYGSMFYEQLRINPSDPRSNRFG